MIFLNERMHPLRLFACCILNMRHLAASSSLAEPFHKAQPIYLLRVSA